MAKKKSVGGNSAPVFEPGREVSWSRPLGFHTISNGRKLRTSMSSSTTTRANDYVCAIEKNQNGKYNVRIRAIFGSKQNHAKTGWTLPIFFLASSFNAAMKKLEEAVQLLQRNEDRLRFWGVERSDDPNMAGDLLREFGLWVDRRRDFPRKVAELRVTRERSVPASALALTRRVLADSIGPERPLRALASD